MLNYRQKILGTFVNVSDRIHILTHVMSNHRQKILGTFWPFVNVSDIIHNILTHVMSNHNPGNVLAICERF